MKGHIARTVTLVLALCLAATSLALAATPLKVAQMPTVVTSFCSPSKAVLAKLDGRVDDALHLPLNDTLQLVSFVPEEDVVAAYEDAQAGSKKGKDIVRAMGESLGADIVVLPVVTGYEQYEHMSWHWDRGMIRTSYAAVSLYVYDRAEDRVIDKGASRSYSDELSVQGEVSLMVDECMDQALREADLHELVRSEAKARKAAKETAVEPEAKDEMSK